MTELTITRFAYTPQGTFGEMLMPDDQKLYTVEQPWRENQQNISCIPEGHYNCRPRRYNAGGYDAIHIHDVPDRSLILFHRGNNQTDVAGCIAPGKQLSYIEALWAVGNSGSAFEILMSHYGEKEFSLTVQGFNPNTDSYAVHPASDNISVTRDGHWSPFPGLLKRHGIVTESTQLEDIDYQAIDLSVVDE